MNISITFNLIKVNSIILDYFGVQIKGNIYLFPGYVCCAP